MKLYLSRIKKFIHDESKFLLVFIIITFFSFYKLPGDLFNADQHFWFERTINFIDALKSGNFGETYQNPKPGVTVMLFSGMSLELFLRIYEIIYNFRPLLYTVDTYLYIDFIVKFPLVITSLLSYLIIYFGIKYIFNKNTALLSLILIGLNPYYIGVSRLFHGDGLMNALFVISVILLLVYFKNLKSKYLILSAIVGGLAFLSKSQAIFLIPYIILIGFIGYKILKISFKKVLNGVVSWLIIFCITVIAVFPAMWVNPLDVTYKILNEGSIVASEGRNFENGINNYLYYFYGLNWVNNPLFIITFIVSLVYYFLNIRKLYLSKYDFFALTSIILLLIFYFIQMSIVIQKSNRYISILIPFMGILVAYFISYLKFNFNKIFYLVLIFVTLNISYYSPYYLALYENSNWGSLSYETSNYLNSKPNSQNFNVVVEDREQSFRPFFKGKIYNFNEIIPKNKIPDYLIITKNNNLPLEYSYCVFDKSIDFRNRNFWNIYKCVK